MFARTSRLMLRPGWGEDAPALHAAIGDEAVLGMLGRAPYPYAIEDAEAFLAAATDLPRLLILARTDAAPDLVGGIGLLRNEDGEVELGYWIARHAWGRGFATEAGHAMMEIAATLGLRRVVAGHHVGNAAFARVLTKLGFERTGRIAPRYSRARDHFVPTALYARDTRACDSLAA